MVFSSLTFLFIFLPFTIISYYISPRRLKNFILLLSSLFFYSYSGLNSLLIMLLCIIMNYIVGILISRCNASKKSKKKFILTLGIVINALILCYYKYSNFFIKNINDYTGSHIKVLNVIMPVGISFFIFQSISYIVDVYRGHGKAQKNPLTVALYISLFPQLIAGPIVRYETVCEELTSRRETIDDFISGIERFIFGLGKKVLLSNAMGIIADSVFIIPQGSLVTCTAWLGAIAYTLQIYLDFSGYSDMAIGLGKMFGFDFLENFDYPYVSTTITEFWRRWHVSLGSWFRDYLYIPLGGNKCSTLKHIRNIFVVWLLTGMWHGAEWTFIIWGLYYGFILILEKYVLKNVLPKLPSIFQHIYTMILVVIGFVFFRAENISFALAFIKSMFSMNGLVLFDKQFFFIIFEYKYELILSLLACMPFSKLINELFTMQENKLIILKHIFLSVVFLLCVISLIKSSFNPFIYFRF